MASYSLGCRPFRGLCPTAQSTRKQHRQRALIAFCHGQGYLWVPRLPSYLLDGVSGDIVI